MRRLTTLVVAMLVAIPMAAQAGGGGGDISQCRGFGSGTGISMLDSCFDAIAFTAPADTAITISNDGQLPHSFTAVDGTFDTGTLQPGSAYELTVDEPGIYEVFCTLHGTAEGGGMTGLLVVGEPDPGTVAAAMNSTQIKAAVAEESRVIADALDRQARSIGDLRASQAELKASLDLGVPRSGPETSPVVVTLPEEAGRWWLQVGVGLAAGLGLAALAVAIGRPRRRDEAATGAAE